MTPLCSRGGRVGSLASGFGQPLRPMAVTGLPTSLRRRPGVLRPRPGRPYLLCAVVAHQQPAGFRPRTVRLTTRSSPIRMRRLFDVLQVPTSAVDQDGCARSVAVGSIESPLTRMIRHTAGCRLGPCRLARKPHVSCDPVLGVTTRAAEVDQLEETRRLPHVGHDEARIVPRLGGLGGGRLRP